MKRIKKRLLSLFIAGASIMGTVAPMTTVATYAEDTADATTSTAAMTDEEKAAKKYVKIADLVHVGDINFIDIIRKQVDADGDGWLSFPLEIETALLYAEHYRRGTFKEYFEKAYAAAAALDNGSYLSGTVTDADKLAKGWLKVTDSSSYKAADEDGDGWVSYPYELYKAYTLANSSDKITVAEAISIARIKYNEEYNTTENLYGDITSMTEAEKRAKSFLSIDDVKKSSYFANDGGGVYTPGTGDYAEWKSYVTKWLASAEECDIDKDGFLSYPDEMYNFITKYREWLLELRGTLNRNDNLYGGGFMQQAYLNATNVYAQAAIAAHDSFVSADYTEAEKLIYQIESIIAIAEAEQNSDSKVYKNTDSLKTEEVTKAIAELKKKDKSQDEQSTVNSAVEVLKKALEGVVEYSDYSSYEEAISKAEELIKSDDDASTDSKYTEDSKQRLQDAIDKANQDKTLDSTHQSEVDEVQKEIERLTESLTENGKADYDVVRKAIEDAEKKLTEGQAENGDSKYTKESIDRLKELIEEARTEINNPKPDSEQSAVDKLAEKINDTTNSLVETGNADYIKVIETVREGESALEDGKLVNDETKEESSLYTDETKQKVDELINKAKEELSTTKTQDYQSVLDKLVEDLKQAIADLKKKEADYTTLEEVIKKAQEAIAEKNDSGNSKYTEESLQRLQDAIEKANQDKANGTKDITQQSEVDTLADSIKKELDALEERAADEQTEESAEDKTNTDSSDNPTNPAENDPTEDTSQNPSENPTEGQEGQEGTDQNNPDASAEDTNQEGKSQDETDKDTATEDNPTEGTTSPDDTSVDGSEDNGNTNDDTAQDPTGEDIASDYTDAEDYVEVTKYDFNRDGYIGISDIIVVARIIDEINEPKTDEETEFVNYVFDRNGDSNISVYDLIQVVSQFNEAEDTYTVKLPTKYVQYYTSLNW